MVNTDHIKLEVKYRGGGLAYGGSHDACGG